ncbi:MAG: accessory factor UbiK family protein [Proteobacteria bacterium]|nr:accessory factor UbiK family protein [Pseudomonadota bacterium]MDA1058715.1 accessory factor UbiK family protein [Pseudomonadota bacterium]
MASNNPIFDDIARVAGGALSAVGGVREEIEAKVKDQFQRWLADMELVTREEFEVVQAMAQKAREQNEVLATRVTALEAALKATAKKPAAVAKPVIDKPAT